MASTFKDWWRKLNEVVFVEKDDALYAQLNPLTVSIGVFSSTVILCSSSFLPVAPWLRGVVPNRWLALLLVLSTAAALGLLAYKTGRKRSTLMARVNTDTLTLALPGSWPSKIEVRLSTLRSMSITLPPPSMFFSATVCSICLTFNDGQEKTVKAFYQSQVGVAVSDFLQRKLPPAITFTAWGRTALDT
jgi:hypothetical protein